MTTNATPDQPDINCATRLVSDQPANRDKFGPHQNVADAIIAMVREEQGGRSIGLSGKWGAGKSTVVRLLQTGFAEARDEVVWAFDAWAHDGDPLRRTFLESLISRLCEVDWITASEWKPQVDVLARRLKTSEQTSTPRLSPFGFVLAVTILLTPIGSALIGGGLKNGVTLHSPNVGLNGLFIWGLLLAGSPVLLVLGRYTWEYSRYWLRVRAAVLQNPLREIPKPDLTDVLALIVTKATTTTKTETIETPDPTSLEFERLFARLMRDALEFKQRRLVLVIDNLDRIEAKDALRIWSTLQTFLQHAATDEPWLRQLWIVMPFDPDGIRRLWDQSSDTNSNLASSFLDKSFQIIFNVPAPVTSDWQGYLIECLREALPNHTDDEFYTVYRMFASVRGATHTPTPREIKIVVNQIGALHRERAHEVPLEHMAYYALQRRMCSPSDIMTALTLGTMPVQADEGLLGPGARDSLAALAFGVSPKRAAQLLLEPVVTDALVRGDASELQAIAQRSEGFPVVIERAVTRAARELPGQEGVKLLCAVAALEGSGILENSLYRPADLIRELHRGAGRIQMLSAPIFHSDEGLITLLRRSGDRELAQRLFDLFGGAVIGDKELSYDQVSIIVLRIVALASGLHSIGFGDVTTHGLTLPGSMVTYMHAMRTIAIREPAPAYDDSCWVLFRPGVSKEIIPEFFRTAIREGRIRMEYFFALRSLRTNVSDEEWNNVVADIRERLRAEQGSDAVEANALLACLVQLQPTPGADEALRATVVEGHLMHHLATATTENNMDTVARCLFVHTLVEPAPRQGQVGRSEEGYGLLATYRSDPQRVLTAVFARLLINYKREDILVTLLRSADARALGARAIAALVEEDTLHDGRAFVTPQLIVEHWSLLEDHINTGRFLDRVDENGQLRGTVRELPFADRHASLYQAILQHQPSDEGFHEWCIIGLRNVPRGTWLAQLRSDGPLLDLLILVMPTSPTISMGTALSGGLHDYAKDLTIGTPSAPASLQRIAAVVSSLGSDKRALLRDQLYDVLQGTDDDVGAPFFDIFGGEIAASRAWKTERTVVRRVLIPILERRNLVGLTWILRQLESGNDIFGKADDGDVRSYKELLSDALLTITNEDSPQTSIIAEIASRLGVVAPDLPAITESTSDKSEELGVEETL